MRVQMTEVYLDWMNSMADRMGRARIQVRVDPLAHGNPGQYRNLSDGVSELKVDVGPGYRVYYTGRGGELIVLLAGGVYAAARYQGGHCPCQEPVGVIQNAQDGNESFREDKDRPLRRGGTTALCQRDGCLPRCLANRGT